MLVMTKMIESASVTNSSPTSKWGKGAILLHQLRVGAIERSFSPNLGPRGGNERSLPILPDLGWRRRLAHHRHRPFS